MKQAQKTKQSFISTNVTMKFNLILTEEELSKLVNRIIYEGIGDWAIVSHATAIKKNNGLIGSYTLPFQVEDIETNKEFIVDKQSILKSIGKTLIDFPYALDTTAGYNLNINKLTQEDIDEIVQVAVFGKIKYGFVWNRKRMYKNNI